MMAELCKWFKTDELTLNINKTCYTIFTHKKRIRDQRIIIDGTEIEEVYCTKYIGILSKRQAKLGTTC